MAKILSEQEIESMQTSVKDLLSSVESSKKACETVINSFTNESIVESFYASGKYGKSEKEEIEKILNAVNKYYGVIASEGGLIDQTNNYLNTQLSLLQSGKNNPQAPVNPRPMDNFGSYYDGN